MPWLLLLLGLGGCMTPPGPAQRVTDAARELNMAARFGRMDLAIARTADGAKKHFVYRRQEWGKELRVVDFKLAGLDMSDADHAVLFVDIQWVRLREGTLRQTRVAQTWSNGEEGGWRLVREKRLAGDVGLFGEPVVVLHPESHGDVHFPSRTIGRSYD
jgi:hypothetical protein